MLHWLFIILGTILISLSFSKKFYLLIMSKIRNNKLLLNFIIIFREIFLLIGLSLIIFGLFIESLN